jgi:hypothetical protein
LLPKRTENPTSWAYFFLKPLDITYTVEHHPYHRSETCTSTQKLYSSDSKLFSLAFLVPPHWRMFWNRKWKWKCYFHWRLVKRTKIDKRNINQPFLVIFIQKMKIKTCFLYFVKFGSTKSPPMQVGYDLQFLLGGRRCIYNTKFTGG